VAGILVSMTSMFVRNQITAYFDVSNRAALADDADTSVRRISREIAGALPNSVRVTCLPAGACTDYYLEFVPIRDGGRYRSETGGVGDHPLDFCNWVESTGLFDCTGATTTQFDVIGKPVRVETGDQIVVYNLGENQPPANVYGATTAENNRRTPSVTGASLSLISAAAPFQFRLASPGGRFQVVTEPVSYVCRVENGKRVISRKTGYGFNAAQPTSFASDGPVLVDNVKSCSFAYEAAVLERNGLASLFIELERNDESVRLQHQVVVNNTP
jgi:MSHA biogenesis protein MshO